ncbi:MAG: hypothetical protein JW763_10980 [candidate division Zixibacteria bacterium]|nr:hypothetical protein [candidate division Zixibacteria bacterium]
MPMLDPNRLPEFVKRYHDNLNDRLVGRGLRQESYYTDLVRFFGHSAMDPKRVTVDYLDQPFHIGDPLIRKFSGIVEKQLRDEGRLYDGPLAMKIADFKPRVTPPTITVQPIEYGQFAGSCFALDLEHELFRQYGGTLREYYKRTYPSNDITDNPLAICLGVCGMVLLEKPSPMLLRVKRAGKLASLESSCGPSVSGGVDYSTQHDNLYDLFNNALVKEIHEEIDLQPGEYHITPLAYAREILRGDHPQIFCLIRTSVHQNEFSQRLHNKTGPDCEFDSFDFVPLRPDLTLDPNTIATFNREGRMNYYLLEEYLTK